MLLLSCLHFRTPALFLALGRGVFVAYVQARAGGRSSSPHTAIIHSALYRGSAEASVSETASLLMGLALRFYGVGPSDVGKNLTLSHCVLHSSTHPSMGLICLRKPHRICQVLLTRQTQVGEAEPRPGVH